MDAVMLIEQAQSMGLALSTDGDKLSITGPKTLAAAALVKQMAPHKADIISALAPELKAPAPQAINPLTLVGQVVSAQRYYELQQATAAAGWTLHGTRHGAVVDGYCNEWLITWAVEP